MMTWILPPKEGGDFEEEKVVFYLFKVVNCFRESGRTCI